MVERTLKTKLKGLTLIRRCTFGIVHNAIFPITPQFYVCRHIWHCAQCHFPYNSPILCVSTHLALCTMPFPYSSPILCVSAHLALCTMPNFLWALKSMRVGLFGIVHNPIPLWALKFMRIDTFGTAHNAIYPMASQIYVCRHIRHCAQCQLCTSPEFFIS